jgi:hypothetical protein
MKRANLAAPEAPKVTAPISPGAKGSKRSNETRPPGMKEAEAGDGSAPRVVATSSAMTSEREMTSSSAHPQRNSTTEVTTGCFEKSVENSSQVGEFFSNAADCSSMLSSMLSSMAVSTLMRSRSMVWWSHNVDPRVYSDADARSITSRAIDEGSPCDAGHSVVEKVVASANTE